MILVTPNEKDTGKFLHKLEEVLANGISTIQLSRPDLSISQYQSLSVRAFELCARYRTKLLLDVSPSRLTDLPNAGLHLNQVRLSECIDRPVNRERLLTASCQNFADIEQAERLDVDAVQLTPVNSSQVCDGRFAWSDVAKICRRTTLPVFAHGALTANDFPTALASGCYGVAVTEDFWGSASLGAIEKSITEAYHRLPSLPPRIIGEDKKIVT